MFPFKYESLQKHDNKFFVISDLGSALFFSLDIAAFECDHPDVFPNSPLAQANERVSELERQLAEARQENERPKRGRDEVAPLTPAPDCEKCPSDQDAKQRHSDLEAANQDLQSRLDAALGGRERWRPSCLALFEAMKQVMENGRDDWTQAEFLNVAREIYKASGAPQCPLDEAERLVWAALPKQFKAGPGNPRYKGNPSKE